MRTVPSLGPGPGWVGKAVTEVKMTKERAMMVLESCILVEFM